MKKILVSACIGLLACSGSDPTNPTTSTTSESAAITTGAQNGDPPIYLALGDSISMGFNPFIVAHNPQAYVGFPEYLARRVGIAHTNAGCFGESTGSFLSPTGSDRGCRHFKDAGLVRAGYTGTQAAFMVDFLQSHSRVKLITFELGTNDFLITLEQCNFDPQCIGAALPGTFQTMASNLVTILGTMRSLYAGQIVVAQYYNPFPTVSPESTQLINATNAILGQIAASFGAQVVDVNATFVAASAGFGGDPCAAGLLIPLTGMNQWVTTVPGASCDSHTTPTGSRLIASTLAPVVSYHGE